MIDTSALFGISSDFITSVSPNTVFNNSPPNFPHELQKFFSHVGGLVVLYQYYQPGFAIL